MKILKKSESFVKNFFYFFFRMLFRNKDADCPVDTEKVKKILILRYDAIGDMIVTTPVFGIINKFLPGAEIHVLASGRNYRLLNFDKRIAGVHVYDLSAGSFIKNVLALRKEKFDVVLSLVLARTTVAGLLANLIAGRLPAKVTLRHDKRYKLYSTFFNIQIPAGEMRGKMTMAEIQSRLVCLAFGWPFDPSLVKITVPYPGSYIEKAANFLAENNIDSFTILNISSGNSFRKWSVSKNAGLIARLQSANPGMVFVIISAPGDFDVARSIKKASGGNVHVFAPSEDIFHVCALIARASMVISPDTSIVHLAAAYGVPVMVMYSKMASYILEWMPFGVPYKALVTKDREPLESLSVEEAALACQSLIKQLQLNNFTEGSRP